MRNGFESIGAGQFADGNCPQWMSRAVTDDFRRLALARDEVRVIRLAAVARARMFLKDPGYPSVKVMRSLADALAVNF